jgi:hypothetical protein
MNENLDGSPALLFHILQSNAPGTAHGQLGEPSQGVHGAIGVDGR